MTHRTTTQDSFSNWQSTLPVPEAMLQPRSSRRRMALPWINYALAVFLYSLLAIFWQASPVPSHLTILSIVVAAICLYPLFLWSARGSQGTPMFELICIAYLMAYSAPVFLVPNTVVRQSRVIVLNWEMMYQALQLALLGIVAMIAGYYFLRRNVFGWPIPRVELHLKPEMGQLYVLMALVVGVVVVVLRANNSLSSGAGWDTIVTLAAEQAQVGVALLAYRVHRPRTSEHDVLSRTRDLTLLCVTVAFLSVFGLATGMLQSVLTPLAIVFVVRWQAKRKFPLALALVGLTAFMVLNPVKNDYRKEAWYSSPNQGIAERISLWFELTRDSIDSLLNSSSSDEATKDFQHSMRRFSLLHNFSEVRRLTPATVPYYQGSTYTYLIYALIPRPLWPDKPIAQEANVRLALDYGILTLRGTARTMIGIGHLPEAYANFGIPGIVVIMFLQGAFFALLDRMLNGPGSDGARAVYLSAMIYFLNGIGSATAALFFAAILRIVPNAFLLRLFSTRKRKNRGVPAEVYATTGDGKEQEGVRKRGWNVGRVAREQRL